MTLVMLIQSTVVKSRILNKFHWRFRQLLKSFGFHEGRHFKTFISFWVSDNKKKWEIKFNVINYNIWDIGKCSVNLRWLLFIVTFIFLFFFSQYTVYLQQKSSLISCLFQYLLSGSDMVMVVQVRVMVATVWGN